MMTPAAYITTSIFDIFKTGPGPSSSHTIGPMKAARMFKQRIDELDLSPSNRTGELRITVHLFGSLSLTGKGHGTHRAVLGGLLGWAPETCDCDALGRLLETHGEIYDIPFKDGVIPFTETDIIFEDRTIQNLPFANTMRFKLCLEHKTIFEQEYYSTGGGFIQCKDEAPPPPPQPPHAYWNMNSLRKLMRKTGFTLDRVILENEQALTGASKEQIFQGIDAIINAMYCCVERGLAADGLLPGPIGLLRKAKVLMGNALKMHREHGRFLGMLNAYAMAASEENADGKQVVTAPTSGAAGVIPAVLYMLKHQHQISQRQLQRGLFAAAAIAFIAKKNASISGAEVGCQGEVGVASAMAAAFMAHAEGFDIKRIEIAAEIALEHQLGMTCDPVGGYVQIPCIERNAIGAVTAVNACILAQTGDPARQKVSFDEVLETMMETGQDMGTRYKETALGGLAVCCVSC